jgi:hypothetical protein
MDDNIKRRMKELGDAINQSLSESEPIADAIAKIKAQGYDVFLVLEATVGFTKQNQDEEEAQSDSGSLVSTRGHSEPKLRMTPQDMKFLKQMRIGID